ncbi:MAG TPA: ABC transporter ATP-binding protein [Micromonosporaceae bacterium]
MASPVIQAAGLVKRYGRGRDAKTALDGLDLTVDTGEVFGYLGPNGAGKTTTIRLMLDFIRPTAGDIRVFGNSPRDNAPDRKRIGYLAGDFVVNGRQTGRELLSYLADLRGGEGAKRIDELAERLDLDLSRRIGQLSKGNRQKIGLVQAFMHNPPLLVLDEPTSGLDPFLQQQFIELVREASRNGQTVFMSSHVLSEVQATCHRVGIIRDGQLVTVANVDELREQALRKIELTFAGPAPGDEFSAIPELRNVTVSGNTVRALLSGSPDTLIKAAAKHDVVGLLAEEPELEELFFTFYQREGSK